MRRTGNRTNRLQLGIVMRDQKQNTRLPVCSEFSWIGHDPARQLKDVFETPCGETGQPFQAIPPVQLPQYGLPFKVAELRHIIGQLPKMPDFEHDALSNFQVPIQRIPHIKIMTASGFHHNAVYSRRRYRWLFFSR